MEKKSKSIGKILLVLGLVVLIAAVGFVMASCGKDDVQSESKVELYWNVEGPEYRSGKFTRMASEDGTVNMIFSKDGEQVRLPVQDYYLACKIDMLSCAGLVFDDNGVVVDALRVEDCTGGYLVKNYIVSAVEGNKITCNSSGLLDGHEVTFELAEDIPVWNIGGTGITVGIPWTVGVDDKIMVVKNEDGSIRCVYTEAYTPPEDVYWNVNRMYDSTSKLSTRMSDVTGGYTVTLACNGEVKDYKVKDSGVVQQIDAMAAKCFGLDFDEEGIIIDVTHAGTATGGGSCASWYHCVSLDDNYAGFKRIAGGSNVGATYNGVLSPSCRVFDVSGSSGEIGVETELRVGDQVHCLRDNRSRICVIFVVSRPIESEIYWNVDRKWDSKSSKTTRTAAADGWYYITVAVRGKQIVVKTQDWDIVNSIDGRAAKCFGLKLGADNVIEKFYTPDQAKGSTFASWYDVTEINGKQITVVKNTTGDERTGMLADNCEIYDVSAAAVTVGTVTEIKVGDRVHTLKDLNGEINVCYVVNRYVDWPVYYNLDRKWSDTTKSTTRKPNSDGYYEFRMACDGEEIWLKTKSIEVANAIDKEVAKCLTLSVDSDGVIYKAMHASNTMVAKGGPTSSYTTVTSVGGHRFTTYKSGNGKVSNEKAAWNMKVYNVSSNYLSHQGEETTLQVGDFVHCLTNRRGEITFVYVMTRPLNLPVYYNLDREWDDTTKTSTRVPDADGVYSFQMAYGGGEVTVKTTDPQVVNDIDKEVAKCVGLRFDENGYVTYATHAKNTEHCGGGIGMSYATVTEVNGKEVTVNKDGKLTTFTISDDCEMFVTTDGEGLTRGQYTTVRVGDFIHCLKAKSGKTNYMAIMSRVKQVPKADHTCQHVTEDVTWYVWDGGSFPLSGYYVLTTDDLELDSRVTIDPGVEITLCLNGHTVTNTDRFFSIYGTLNICDHKDADGNYKGTLTTSYSGKVYGGIAYMYNSKGNALCNIYGGNLVHTGEVTNGGLFYVGNTSTTDYLAELNLYDGVLSGGKSTGNGAGVIVGNGCAFSMFGGKITDCVATGSGGGVNIETGVFNMTGGVLEGNEAKEGGNIRVSAGGTANISNNATVRGGIATNGGNFTVIGKLNITDGATIGAGKVTGAGSNISAFANAASAHAIITVKNVTMEGTVRLDTGKGPVEMFVTDAIVKNQIKVGVQNCTLTVAGKVELSEVRLMDGKVITISENGLDDASVIYVRMDNAELPFTTITDLNDEGCFKPADSIYKIVNTDNALYLESTVKPHVHCVCGMNKTVGDHTSCNKTTQWTAWAEKEYLPASGNIVLMENVYLGNSTFTVASGNTLSICLNGHTIRSDIRVFSIRGTLNITDCSGTGSVIGNEGGTQANGGVFYIYNNGRFNFYGGTLTATKKVTGEGGVGCVAGGTNGIMNIYGGTIESGKATKNGGNIVIWDGAVLNIHGGTIQNGTSTGGGNVAATKGMLNITGGKLIGGISSGYGGNVRVGQDAMLKVTGGEILGGTAKSGGATIYGNRSGSTYADIQLLGGKITAGKLTDITKVGQNCVLNYGSVIVGGNVQVEDIYVGSNKLIESSQTALTTAAKIGVSNASAVTFMENVGSDVAACFTSKSAGLTVVYDEAAQTLKLA